MTPVVTGLLLLILLHTDKIVPIVYGLPTSETIEKEKKGELYIRGCLRDKENWYCKKHDIAF
ncbi:MAG TPA: hypothetical protein VI489_05830 [Candidatus Brocadiaceae bacterium]